MLPHWPRMFSSSIAGTWDSDAFAGCSQVNHERQKCDAKSRKALVPVSRRKGVGERPEAVRKFLVPKYGRHKDRLDPEPRPWAFLKRSTQSRVLLGLFVMCFMNLHLRWPRCPTYFEGHRKCDNKC